jgi:hypothetical protein
MEVPVPGSKRFQYAQSLTQHKRTAQTKVPEMMLPEPISLIQKAG